MEGNCFKQIHGYELITVKKSFKSIGTVKHKGHVFCVYKISEADLNKIPENDISDNLMHCLRKNELIIIRDGKDCATFGFPTSQEAAVELAKKSSDMLDAQHRESSNE